MASRTGYPESAEVAPEPGASRHLVPASQLGARMRPTIVGPGSGRANHCSRLSLNVHSSQATPRSNWEIPGASVTELGSDIARGGSDDRSRIQLTSRVTGLRPTGLVTVGAAALISPSSASRSPSGIGGRSRIFERIQIRWSDPCVPERDACVVERPDDQDPRGSRGPHSPGLGRG